MDIQPELREKVNALLEQRKESMGPYLGISYEKMYKDEIIGTMPVNERTRQPFGFLHGGASLVLAESLASVGGWLNIDENRQLAMGIDINASHMKAVRQGLVRGRATPLHRGRRTHVWQIDIRNDREQLVCTSHCTLAITARNT